MAALVICAFSLVEQLCDLTDALFRTGFHFRKSYNYLQIKRQRILFRQYCREAWLRETVKYALGNIGIPSRRLQLILSGVWPVIEKSDFYNSTTKTFVDGADMQRGGIDFANFAAIEASVEALENVDRNRFAEEHQDYEYIEDYNDIDIIDGVDVQTSFYEYADTLPIYHNNQIGLLREGISFTFNGYIPHNCERFSINFIIDNATSDIALHINPRLPQSYIVRNTRVKNVWGHEEVASALPFSLNRGTKFTIQVLLTDECYMLSVNGHHFAKYQHRLPYTAVNVVEVKGDVEILSVDQLEVHSYPERVPSAESKEVRVDLNNITQLSSIDQETFDQVDNAEVPQDWCAIHMPGMHTGDVPSRRVLNRGELSMPYLGKFPTGSIFEGRLIKLIGRVKLLPHSFYINLQQGNQIWPHPNVAFHFNPRFSKMSGAMGKAIVCRNAWYGGKWAQEERSELDTDFRPGKMFALAIVCGAKGFEVYVNRKLITEFSYHIEPNRIDTIYVQGDIKLWDVVVENSHALALNRNRGYENPVCKVDP